MAKLLIKHEVNRDKNGLVVGLAKAKYGHATVQVDAVIDNGKRVRTTSGDVWEVKPVEGQPHQFETVVPKYHS